MGNTYIIDLSGMQQINEDTGNARSIRRTVLEPPKNTNEGLELEDERGVALREDPELGASFVQALFGVLYEVFNSMVRERGRGSWVTFFLWGHVCVGWSRCKNKVSQDHSENPIPCRVSHSPPSSLATPSHPATPPVHATPFTPLQSWYLGGHPEGHQCVESSGHLAQGPGLSAGGGSHADGRSPAPEVAGNLQPVLPQGGRDAPVTDTPR